MRLLGFKYDTKKKAYVDDHKRDDVVANRQNSANVTWRITSPTVNAGCNYQLRKQRQPWI